MMIILDLNDPQPIYEQLQDQLIMAMAKGILKDGDTLPPVRRLASELGINLHTVNKAYQWLRDQGYIDMQPRSGATVNLRRLREGDFLAMFDRVMENVIARAICHGYDADHLCARIRELTANFASPGDVAPSGDAS